MKNNIIILIISCLIFTICLTGCNSQQFISQNDAINAVRDFEGNQTLQFKVNPLFQYEEGQVWQYEYMYTIDLITNSEIDHSWNVNAISGEVTSALYMDRIPTEETEIAYGDYTQAQCRQIALEYAQDKYDEFTNMNFQLINEKWSGHGWRFSWSQILQNGATTNNYINISINPDTGSVQGYSSRRYQISDSNIPPQLTPQQVVNIAVQELGITSELIYDAPKLKANPDNLYYSFNITGMNSNNEWQTGIYEINADTGDIIAFHVPDTSVLSPIKINAAKKSVSLKLTKFPNNQKIEKIKTNKTYATFMFNKKAYKLNNGSDMLLSGTKKFKMSGKCSIKKDGVYVPSDFAKTLLKTNPVSKTPMKSNKPKSVKQTPKSK